MSPLRAATALCFLLSSSATAQTKPAKPLAPSPRAAIQALLVERDRAFGARDAAAYLAVCAPDYVHTNPEQDTVSREKLQAELQKQLTGAAQAEQTTQLDSLKLEGGAALVETYERVKLLSLSHEWLEIKAVGYRRCRYRFVPEGTRWRLARTRVLEDVLEETPRLLDSPGLAELEKRVPNAALQAIVREVFPKLETLARAEEQKDFALFREQLSPDFVFVRLGKDPENRTSYIAKMSEAHEYIARERVRYYLVGAERQESGDLTLEVEQAMRYTMTLPGEPPEDNLMILNLALTWTQSAGSWSLKRWEHFTVEGFENGKRVDFVQKEKNRKK